MSANLEMASPRVVPIRPSSTVGSMFDVPGCTFTPTGLIIKRGMPIDDWVKLGAVLRKAGDGVQLWLGDWIRYGKHEYGKKYAAALALTGYKEGTLRDNVWVANAVPLSARADNLTFRHYRVVAKLPSKKDIKKWLGLASKGDGKKKWSAAILKREITRASQPSESKSVLFQELQKLHDKVVRDELGEKLAAVRSWLETPADPLLSTVYRKLIEILEWQRNRTAEGDCAAIMRMFTGDEGTEAPERASDGDIASWLHDHGFIMSREEIGDAGNPDPKNRIEPSGRIGLMLKLKLLVVMSRETSRQEGRKGSIPAVYAVERDYMTWLDDISDYALPERTVALRRDWTARVARYAPELVSEKERAA